MAKPIFVGHTNKRHKGRSNSHDERKPRVATAEKITAQREYRLGCLEQRRTENRLTDKNQKEIESLAL